MAGGMGRKGDDFGRETLAERVVNTRARQTGHGTAGFHGTRPATWMPPSAPEPAAPFSPPPKLRHCWYAGPLGRQPALFLRWRNIDGHYDGLIVVAAPDEDGTGWAVVEMWAESGLLSPT